MFSFQPHSSAGWVVLKLAQLKLACIIPRVGEEGGERRTKSPSPGCLMTCPALQSVLERRDWDWGYCSHIAPLEAGTVVAIIYRIQSFHGRRLFFFCSHICNRRASIRWQVTTLLLLSFIFSSPDSHDEEADWLLVGFEIDLKKSLHIICQFYISAQLSFLLHPALYLLKWILASLSYQSDKTPNIWESK